MYLNIPRVFGVGHVGHVVTGGHVGHDGHVGHVVWPAVGGNTELTFMCRWILHVPSILRVYCDDEEPKPTPVLASTCMYKINVTLMSSTHQRNMSQCDGL